MEDVILNRNASEHYWWNPSVIVNDSEWHHIIINIPDFQNVSQSTLYIDGLEQTNITKDTASDEGEPEAMDTEIFFIGALNGGSHSSELYLDNIMLFTQNISDESELLKLYPDSNTENYYKKYENVPAGVYEYSVYAEDLDGRLTVNTRNITLRDSFDIIYPITRNVYQRDSDGEGGIYVELNLTGNVEGYTSIDNLTIDYTGTTSGSYVWDDITSNNPNVTFNVPEGEYTLKIKNSDDETVFKSVDNIGVGEVILVMGQSNAVPTLSGWLNTSLDVNYTPVTVYPNYVSPGDYSPADTVVLNTLPRDARQAANAYEIAHNENVPVMIINVAVGGASVSKFNESTELNRSGYIGNYYTWGRNISKIYTGYSMKIRGAYWYQGESDAVADVESDWFYEELGLVINQTLRDYDLVSNKFLIGQLHAWSTGHDVSPVRNAQQRLWNNRQNVYPAFVTYDMYTSNVHWDTDVSKDEFSRRIGIGINYQFYGRYNESSFESNLLLPVVTSVNRVYGNPNALLLTYNTPNLEISKWNDTGEQPVAKGIVLSNSTSEINDNNVISTSLEEEYLRVDFDTNISGMTNFSYCADIDCSNLAVVRSTNTQGEDRRNPTEILYNIGIEDSGANLSVTSPFQRHNYSLETVLVNFSASDAIGIDRVWYNYTGTLVDDSIVNGSGISASGVNSIVENITLEDGNYTINFYANNTEGALLESVGRSFNISSPNPNDNPQYSSDSSGGRGSVSVNHGSLESLGNKGFTDEVGYNEKVYFKIKNESHNIVLKRIDRTNKTVKFDIYSEKQTVYLKENQSKEIYLDEEVGADILLTLNSIKKNSVRANITLGIIDKEDSSEEEFVENNMEDNSTQEAERIPIEENRELFLFWIPIVLIIVGIVAWFIYSKKEYFKKKFKKIGLSLIQ